MAASIVINLALLSTLVTVAVCIVFDRHGWDNDVDDEHEATITELAAHIHAEAAQKARP